ncbi:MULTISPECIES: primosomal protein N' [unclassified Fibrobacter]|uniref:replication restart helicase PriA n=1 Tax=unclassified Fibrobacter TaxID=2634177 RepID=UPI000D6B9267|nr:MULTISPECIES: primosomal protein N' [unclassified Fibrobacter]PWJ64437.1 replication restart DNA helicase PriA [Fibrobacter sp. UWR4]PZW69314.1 replication restart DNA helicase PriA [Fibrobacter sp. UWR1]
MAKRIPKIIPPEEIKTKVKSATLTQFCEVYIPMAPAVYTYGVPQGVEMRRGNLVWVQFATRKKPALAVVSKVHWERPSFDVRLAMPHQSGFSFSERYMENLEWTASYYISTPMKALFVFWPADFERFLEAYAARENAEQDCRCQNIADAETALAQESRCRNEFGMTRSGMTCGLPPRPEDLPPLTLEQKNALQSLVADLDGTGFRGTLLHGVTGSGKTRVYQELAYEALSRGKRVLILVPEIGLTPQTASRFENFLQVPVVVLHSALSSPKKRAGYVSIMDGSAQVVLGTRSAILAPFDFDLVIVDEEHDSSFKQQDPAPRYHTRDLAFHLAYRHGALVVLGSATPSLETYNNAKAGNLKVLTLKERATQAPMPQVSILDMCKMRQQKGIMLSPQLREALTDCVAAGGQAIVLMNRRGYSKIRVCSECGETLYCKDCHVPLVYHKQYSSLMCHYCGRLYPVNSPCHSCGAETYEFVGGAIEMLEDEIQEWVAGAKVIRMDRDTTQNVGASEKILDSFRNREYNILIGTQMVAKGHDFPGVRLVGVVGADSGLGIPDFRSGEKMYQLLSQTAGRAGRAGDVPGQVFIQTLKPTEPVMQFAVHHDFEGFAAKEVQDRQDAFYPPFCKLVEISCGSKDESLLTATVNRLEQILRAEKSLLVLGPVDAFISMVQNVRWAKLYVKTKDLVLVRRILSPIVNAPKPWAPGVDIKVEID